MLGPRSDRIASAKSSRSSSEGLKSRDTGAAPSGFAANGTSLRSFRFVRGCRRFRMVVSLDTHNDLRLAVDALSGELSDTIYAEDGQSVRRNRSDGPSH
jgi:hypothetical protein